MNETPDPREQLYARVTAWVLGELSPAEAAAMAERVKRDRELERLAKRVRHTIGLLRAASKATAQPGVAPSAPAEPMQLDAHALQLTALLLNQIRRAAFAAPHRFGRSSSCSCSSQRRALCGTCPRIFVV